MVGIIAYTGRDFGPMLKAGIVLEPQRSYGLKQDLWLEHQI